MAITSMVRGTEWCIFRDQNLKYKDSIKVKELNEFQIQDMRNILRKEFVNGRK